ncbi:MAG: hypothetical protein WBD02_06770 [Acidimicrobiia bacterium]
MATLKRSPLAHIAAMTSVAAGLVHAAAAGTHAEHRQAGLLFASAAILEIGWAAWVWNRPSRTAFFGGAVLSIASVSAWVLAKTRGISFIVGLESKEALQFADGWATALEVMILVLCVGMLFRSDVERSANSEASGLRSRIAIGSGAVLILGSLPAMVAPHEHADATHDHGTAAATHDHGTTAATHDHGTTADAVADPAAALGTVHSHLSPDGTMPVAKPTKEQQDRADLLVIETEKALAPLANVKIEENETDGRFFREPSTNEVFRSIRDGEGGYEHFVAWRRLDDRSIVDPSAIESVVVSRKEGPPKVVAAMYVLPSGTLDGNVPDVGGPLTGWHVHEDLCFNDKREVAGTWSKATGCPEGSVRWVTAPMLHVWLTDTSCGRFAEIHGAALAGGTCGASTHTNSHSAASHDPDAISTPEPLAEEAELIRDSKAAVKRYVTTADAEAAGYRSIGDAMTGFEHFVNTPYLNDGYAMDAAHVESLVFKVEGAKKTLVSAMYILRDGSMMSDVPDFGGPRVMWHNHTDLCWVEGGRVAGVHRGGRCVPFGKLRVTAPMLHVWVIENKCGPFAGVEAIKSTGCAHETPEFTGALASEPLN